MKSFKFSTEEVTALMLAMPPEARQPDSGILYDGGDVLEVPDVYVEQVKSLTKGAGWAGKLALAGARAAAKDLLLAEADRLATSLVSGYSDAERSAWPAKLDEARAVLADPAAPTPLLGIEARLRGVTVADLAARIVAKAPLTLAIPAAVAGLRAATEATIDAAADQAEIDAALTAAKVKAEALAAAIAAGDMAAFEAAL